MIKIKKELDGKFEQYIKNELNYSERTAQNLIRVANEFQDTQTFSYLSSSKVFALLDIPQENRSGFIDDHNLEDLTVRELKKEIQKYKEENGLLTEKQKKALEENLLSNGYVGSPIYTWNGYIVDGHNRYEICKKHNMEFKFEELFTMEVSKTDVMEWMINTQLGRRNLIPAQRILIVQKFRDRVKEEARKNQGSRNDIKSNTTYSPKGENVKKVHTEKELAKMAGVGYHTRKKRR